MDPSAHHGKVSGAREAAREHGTPSWPEGKGWSPEDAVVRRWLQLKSTVNDASMLIWRDRPEPRLSDVSERGKEADPAYLC